MCLYYETSITSRELAATVACVAGAGDRDRAHGHTAASMTSFIDSNPARGGARGREFLPPISFQQGFQQGQSAAMPHNKGQ